MPMLRILVRSRAICVPFTNAKPAEAERRLKPVAFPRQSSWFLGDCRVPSLIGIGPCGSFVCPPNLVYRTGRAELRLSLLEAPGPVNPDDSSTTATGQAHTDPCRLRSA